MSRTVFTSLAPAVAVALIFLFGALEFVENRILDARFGLLERPAGDRIVLVTIDSRSLKDIGVWPWPRRHYAEVLDRLVDAGAERIALNVDFSSASSELEDSRLEATLADSGGRIILPAFGQLAAPANAGSPLIFTEPLQRFAIHTQIASVNLVADNDGTVRRMTALTPWRGGSLPTLTSMLTLPARTIPPQFHIDYGIDPRTFRQISFVDVLEGRFEAATFVGKTIIIGSTAAEVGDLHQTPSAGYLPGSFIHALAVESIDQGRALQRMPPILVIGGIVVIAFMLTYFCGRRSWPTGLAATIGVIAAVALAALVFQAVTPVLVEIVPWSLAAALSYGLGLGRLISTQDLRLLANKITIGRQDAHLQGLVNAAFDGIITVDEDGSIRSANRTAEQMFGCPEGFLIGQAFTVMFRSAPWNAGNGAGFLEEAATDGEPREVVGVRRTGENFDASLAVTQVPGEDRVLYVLILLDVSARRKAEMEAAGTRRRLAEAIDSIPDGIVLWDSDDRLATCNKHYAEFHGPAAHVLTPGCPFDEFVRTATMLDAYPDAEARESEWISERIDRHRNPGASFIQRTADGRWLRTVERRTADGGIIGVETDVTEEHFRATQLMRARDTAESANRAKTKFLANMSHELRTPLNAILGFSEVIRDKMLGEVGNPKYTDYAHDIHRSGSDLLAMIDDILEASRIESGTSLLHEGDVNLYRLIEDGIHTLESASERAAVEISLECAKGLPDIRADRRKIKQCFINVVGNAIRFSPAGGKVAVRMRPENDGLSISVEDSGPGMTDAEITRALEPFGQVTIYTGRENSGLGLGLPVANMEMEQHGGRLEIVNGPSAGTTVTMRIPSERMLAGRKPGAVVRLTEDRVPNREI